MSVGIGHSFPKFVLHRAGVCCCGGGQPEGISGREGRTAGGMTGGEKDVQMAASLAYPFIYTSIAGKVPVCRKFLRWGEKLSF